MSPAKRRCILGPLPEELNLITLHLGNGASVAAIREGKSIDTSMGMTPLEGLVMGTRSGDLDPAIPFYLIRELALSPEKVENLLNKESGLKGICGLNDMREIQQRAGQGDECAVLAFDMFCYRVKKYIGAYYAVLGRLDVIVFTGGIGENSGPVRSAVCGESAAPGDHSGRAERTAPWRGRPRRSRRRAPRSGSWWCAPTRNSKLRSRLKRSSKRQ